VYCTGLLENKLYEVHDAPGHPVVTRLHHFVRKDNLPNSMNVVLKTVWNCRVCSEVKHNFYKKLIFTKMRFIVIVRIIWHAGLFSLRQGVCPCFVRSDYVFA